MALPTDNRKAELNTAELVLFYYLEHADIGEG